MSAVSLSEAPTGPALELDGLPGLLGFQLRMAHVALYRDFTGAMADIGLTQKQYAALRLIFANPGVSQAELASVLGTDRATMMALIDRLDQRELVERVRSTNDRRRQELYLTSAGKALLTKSDRAIAAHEKRFAALFTEKEYKALLGALARLHGQEDLSPDNAR